MTPRVVGVVRVLTEVPFCRSASSQIAVRSASSVPTAFEGKRYLTLEGPVSIAWGTADLSPSGVLGDSRQATAEKGERLLRAASDRTVEVVEALLRRSLP